MRATVPLVQEKIAKLSEYPEFAGFLFRDVEPDPALLDGRVLEEAEQALGAVEPFTTETIEQALRALSEQLGLKPREAFQPIRVAVTGSKVSPGLFESIELLGRDATLERIRRAQAANAPGPTQRLRRSERVKRALELSPGAGSEAWRRAWGRGSLEKRHHSLRVLRAIYHSELATSDPLVEVRLRAQRPAKSGLFDHAERKTVSFLCV